MKTDLTGGGTQPTPQVGPWRPDLLGEPWMAQTIDLPMIRDRKTVATLVTTRAELAHTAKTALLYLHGYNDYFFQTHVAQAITDLGIAFYALDLHGYGRSTLDEESRNDCWSLREYGPELAAATRYLIEERGYEHLVILGHSTGGLIASLWARSPLGAATVSALLLNSPWLDLNRPWFDRVIGTAAIDAVGNYLPNYAIVAGGSWYAHRLHVSNGGDWDFDLDMKRSRPAPVRMGWLRAIREGQLRVHRGLELEIPILVMASDRSSSPLLTEQNLTSDQAGADLAGETDTVLDVQQIVDRAPNLGTNVTVTQIRGGNHDLALGNPASRAAYLATIEQWLTEHGFATPKHTDAPDKALVPGPNVSDDRASEVPLDGSQP